VGLFEVNEAAEVVTAAADANANVIFGAVIDPSMGEEVRVTVIATGFGQQLHRHTARRSERERVGVSEAPVSREPDQGFDMPSQLDVPSFLRDG